jgi:cytidylate kinase
MKKLKLYLDTNVYSGLKESLTHPHRFESERLIKYIVKHKHIVVVSDLNVAEISSGPETLLKTFLYTIKQINTERIEVEENQEIQRLASFYIKKSILTKKHFRDALHIAASTVTGVDVLISWNFDDIVNMNKIPKIISANYEAGYFKNFQIISPMEVR